MPGRASQPGSSGLALVQHLRAQVGLLVHRLPRGWRSLALRVRHMVTPRDGVRRLDTLRLAEAPTRLVVAPANFAGQAAAWAGAVRQTGQVSTAVVEFGDGRLAFLHDLLVPAVTAAGDPVWARDWFAWVVRHATHVLAEAGRPLFGQLWSQDVTRELLELERCGLQVAVMAHGTDIRVPSEHAALEPWSPFRESFPARALMEHRARTTVRLLAGLPVPRFVSTPDLVDLLPDARWCPVVVATQRWQRLPPAEGSGRMRVVHVPSNERIKGSALVEPDLRRLHQAGRIHYRRATGIPAAQMPAMYGDAHVVIDQFRIGNYGVAACEAMAAGRVVVSHVSDIVRARVLAGTGLRLPIVEATPDTLTDVLDGLATDPERRARLGQEGRSFVDQIHDGRRSAAVLSEWLRSASFTP